MNALSWRVTSVARSSQPPLRRRRGIESTLTSLGHTSLSISPVQLTTRGWTIRTETGSGTAKGADARSAQQQTERRSESNGGSVVQGLSAEFWATVMVWAGMAVYSVWLALNDQPGPAIFATLVQFSLAIYAGMEYDDCNQCQCPRCG